MVVCGNNLDPLDFQSPCIRELWGSFLPAGLVLVLYISAVPMPHGLNVLCSPFKNYMTLNEAEALDGTAPVVDKIPSQDDKGETVQLWRAVVFVFVGIIQCFSWTAHASYRLYNNPGDLFGGVLPFLVAMAWMYTIIRPISHLITTSPFDLFSVYLVLFCAGFLRLGGILFDHNVFGSPWPSTITLTALSTNLFVLLVLLIVVLDIPMALPSNKIYKKDIGHSISPENYTSLWGWITFSWVYPLIQKGRHTTLNEPDVWNLSATMQSHPIFVKFCSIHRSSLLRRIWAANSLDFILDFILTVTSVIFNYSGPFFLKKILDAIDLQEPTPESRTKAYIYAFLAFAVTLLKAQADVQHLWFGRRAATRIRSELMASIYDKALKRKDFSGVTNKDKQEDTAINNSKDKTKAQQKEERAKAATADDPKAGADVGKIVNLMAGDANKVAQTASSVYFIYAAPFEILIGGIFLYQLLGVSAFAGFLVLLAGWPLNSLVSRRSVRIQKGLLAARDKRMGVLNELIGAVKFIKFFAWEERWINGAMDAREVEMKWMVKDRINSMFFVLWTCAPILISITSFFAYVMQGNQLTIGVAFTAIALFNMIRGPLNAGPAWIVQLFQTGVSLKRITVYLDEEEVTDQVSSLKKDHSQPYSSGDDEGLGLEGANLKWNEVVEAVGKGKESTQTKSFSSPTPEVTDESSTVIDNDVSERSIGERRDRVFELRDMTIRFPEGELTVVTGPTASGKTALLMAILGEMTLVEGRIVMSKEPSRVDENGFMHSISYAAQTPWLRHQSIKDNILFGYPLDEERYNTVIECCALQPDLDILEDGDATEIGARGVSLSGGQKARVALARAVYTRTKYVLLDDPLSAVDGHTSRFLYEKLLRGPLLTNRTVVLVTHHLELVLPGAYYLVRMLDGRIDTQGTVKELRAQGLLKGIEHDAAVETHKKELVVAETAAIVAEESLDTTKITKKPRKLVEDEHREIGSVKWSIYKSYLTASSYWTWVILIILVFINQLCGLTEKLWLKTWGEAFGQDAVPTMYAFRSWATTKYEVPLGGNLMSPQPHHWYLSVPSKRNVFDIDWPSASQHPLFYVGIYAAIGLSTALCSFLSVGVLYLGALRASRVLFKQLLFTVVGATFRFHDTTPQGRMLNRFGKDVETIDLSVAGSLSAVKSSLFTFFAAIITVSVVFPSFLVPAFIIGLVYWELAIGYLNTGRDLRRMESNSRSPIFSDFGELLEGIVTVRAFSAETRFFNNLHVKIDTTTKMWYNFWMTTRWLLLNFDALGGLSVLITTLFSISTLTNGAGLAGVCISSAMSFTTSVYFACRSWTELELDLNSVERITEYLDLPQEPPAVIESHRVPAYWPSLNANNDSLLVVENLIVKYAPDLPAVLHDVSFTLKARERVGLLGRTGSGKSTLAMSILRFVNPMTGRIIIDGIDISTIGIHDLRSRLTLIPQDATLFSGTLRDNLDPFCEHTDSECLDVLCRVQIITASARESQRASEEQSIALSHTPSRPSFHPSELVSTGDIDTKMTVTLDTKVSSGGANFSQGQKQLIAMARALLRRSSIIVLDEATSSIDFETDAKIQTTIREEFNDSLLLTVAHRFRTVIDYDRLIVLDKGEIVEFDTPWNLIQKEDGIFRNMCLKSGIYGELEAAARAKAEAKASTASTAES